MQRKPTRKFWNAYGQLYGDLKPLPAKTKRKVERKCPTEQQEQFKLVHWLRLQNILFYHIPNGGKRNIIEAAKFKRLGVSPGVPDICLPIPHDRKGHHGLYIELKTISGGVISDSQQEWIEKLTKNGYLAVICKGADEAIEVIKDYLNG